MVDAAPASTDTRARLRYLAAHPLSIQADISAHCGFLLEVADLLGALDTLERLPRVAWDPRDGGGIVMDMTGSSNLSHAEPVYRMKGQQP